MCCRRTRNGFAWDLDLWAAGLRIDICHLDVVGGCMGGDYSVGIRGWGMHTLVQKLHDDGCPLRRPDVNFDQVRLPVPNCRACLWLAKVACKAWRQVGCTLPPCPPKTLPGLDGQHWHASVQFLEWAGVAAEDIRVSFYKQIFGQRCGPCNTAMLAHDNGCC